MPSQLRHLATILLNNDSCNPAVIREKYKYSFIDDFLHLVRKSVHDIDADEHILNAALMDIEKHLKCDGKCPSFSFYRKHTILVRHSSTIHQWLRFDLRVKLR